MKTCLLECLERERNGDPIVAILCRLFVKIFFNWKELIKDVTTKPLCYKKVFDNLLQIYFRCLYGPENHNN